jgi:hypothetical protein
MFLQNINIKVDRQKNTHYYIIYWPTLPLKGLDIGDVKSA